MFLLEDIITKTCFERQQQTKAKYYMMQLAMLQIASSFMLLVKVGHIPFPIHFPSTINTFAGEV